MLPKFLASWLVVLVLVPFTAPFSTCDLASLFGNNGGAHSPIAPLTSAALTTDAAVPTALFATPAGRVRHLPLSRVSVAESAALASPATVISSVPSAGSIREHAALSTILRL
jgi:hypothetical protein